MNTKPLQQFRDTVYQALPKRADATMDLLDALTTATSVSSPVALSESPLFRRGFASVYDVLEEGDLPEEALQEIFQQSQPATCETIAGYEVYAVDCTSNPRPEAETLPERIHLKSQTEQVAQVGERFKGRPPAHGPVFKLTAPSRPADRVVTTTLAGQKVRLSAWHNLHLRKLPQLIGMLLRVVSGCLQKPQTAEKEGKTSPKG